MWTSIFEFNYWLKQLFDDVWIWDTLLSMIWQHLPSFESTHISSFCIIKKRNPQKLGLYFLIFLLNNFWQRRKMQCSLHRDTITPLRYIVYQWKLGCHPPHYRKRDLTKEEKTLSKKSCWTLSRWELWKIKREFTKRPLGSTKGTFKAFSFINAQGCTCGRKIWQKAQKAPGHPFI